MDISLKDKVIENLQLATQHNTNLMITPEAILWPDPENQWVEVICELQKTLPQLLVYGTYEPSKKQGPAIWLKCMVSRSLHEADWPVDAVPVIYLPGVAKTDLRNVQIAVFDFQPLLEYQYTGTLFLQENGKEWSILAFLENPVSGLGVKVAKDNATRDALKKTLPVIFQDREVFKGKSLVDAEYLNNLMFPDMMPSILKWMCKGDSFLNAMETAKREVFTSLCSSQYDFLPDHRNIISIAEKLGSQRNSWKYVWQLFANSPRKYPEIEELLRQAKPADLGKDMFAYPVESWPQVNEQAEEALRTSLMKMSKSDPSKALSTILGLESEHKARRFWVWYELGRSPLADALQYLAQMAFVVSQPFPFSSIDELKSYYITQGYKADQNMRKALAAVKTEKDKTSILSAISLFYKPWLESVTLKFQQLVSTNASIFTDQIPIAETESCLLFVDALRYELALDFMSRLSDVRYKVAIEASWSSIPSLTPTSKPSASPIASLVSDQSSLVEFRPQLKNGKDLVTSAFRDALTEPGFKFVTNPSELSAETKSWLEIGDIDSKGHTEQADMVKRIDELFSHLEEILESLFLKGIKRIKIVTDHGWLLLPGGLPKTQLNPGLTETRWGRCALIKEGAPTDLLHLPWRWNKFTYVAYAPGISFFKVNQEYAHGGISLHECLVPVMIIEKPEISHIQAEIKVVKWVGLMCTVLASDVPDGYLMDIRTKYNDPKTSLVLSKNPEIKGNSVTLMVDDETESQAATIVLMDENERILDKKPTTIGG